MWQSTVIPIILGFVAGVCGGFWSIGAGWVVTPVLLLLGIQPAAAVAATAAHIALKSIPATEDRLATLTWEPRGTARKLAVFVLLPGALGSVVLNLAWQLAVGTTPTNHAVLDWGYLVILVGVFLAGLRVMTKGMTHESHWVPSGNGEWIQHLLVGVGRGFLSLAFGIGGGVLSRSYYSFMRRNFSEDEIAVVSQTGVLVASLSTMVFYWQRGLVDWSLVGALSLGGLAGQTLGKLLHRRSPSVNTRDKAIGVTFLVGLCVLATTHVLRLAGLKLVSTLVVSCGAAAISVGIVVWFFLRGHRD